MPECKRGCKASKLLPAFIGGSLCREIEKSRVTAALKRLCSHAKGLNKLLCGITPEEMQRHFCYLYSLEDDSYTADDSDQEIYIIRLFYDYLIARGCAQVNPVKVLKDAAKRAAAGQAGRTGIHESGDRRRR